MKRNTPLAPFWTRMLAHNIDLIILLPFAYGLGYFIQDDRLLYTLIVSLYMVYCIGFELGDWQGTPGKRILGIQVTNVSEQAPSPGQTIIRNLLKPVSLIPAFAGILMIIFHPRRQALHDWIAGTALFTRRNS